MAPDPDQYPNEKPGVFLTRSFSFSLGILEQFWAAYVPCGSQYLDAVKQTLEQIDLIKRMVDRYSNYLRLATDAKGMSTSIIT